MRAATLTLCLLVAPAAALAQERDSDALDRAVVLFEESETLYNQGEFEQAAALLRRAYALHADATLLFNLARALEGAGDLDGAIDAYARYLQDAPDARDRGAVEARLTTLRAQRDALAQPAVVEPAEPDPVEAPTEPGRPVEVAPWIVLGAGVAVVGVGVALGVVSQDLGARAAAERAQVDAVALHADAETYAIAADVLFVVGGLAAAAGLVWGIVSLTSGGDDEPSAELRVGPGSVAVAGRF